MPVDDIAAMAVVGYNQAMLSMMNTLFDKETKVV